MEMNALKEIFAMWNILVSYRNAISKWRLEAEMKQKVGGNKLSQVVFM